MSFRSEVETTITEIGTDWKLIWAAIGVMANLDGPETDLVAAVNAARAAGGGSDTFAGLTDVDFAALTAGDIVRFDGAKFVNEAGDDVFDLAGAAAAAQAASQPASAELDVLAGLTSTATGRGVLQAANQAALTALLGAATTAVAGIARAADDTTTLAGVDGSRFVTPASLAAFKDALVDAAPGTMDTLNELAAALGDNPNFATDILAAVSGKQTADATLTALAALVTANDQMIYATGVDSFAMTSLTATGRGVMGAADKPALRTYIDVYSKAEIGDLGTIDLLATYNAAKA